MKKHVFVAALMFGTYFVAQAQDGGKVLINTEYDEPYRNKWNVAAFAGLEIQAKSSGGLYYGASARYTLAKVATFYANLGLDMTSASKSGGILKFDEELMGKLPSFKTIELRGTFHFKDQEGQKTQKVSLGSDGRYEYSTNYTTKSRVVRGITASLNFNSRAYVQNVDSTLILDVRDQNGGNPGYIQGLATGQNNMFIGLGFHMAEYTFYKGQFTGGAHGTTKTRRLKRMVNTNFELLFAPAIAVGDEAYLKDGGQLFTYNVENVEKKNLGFRITADVLNGKPGFYARVEMGTKPGIKAPLKTDSKIGKYLTNGYFAMSFGFGF
ncbi:MAG: hypothetical protein EP338_13020 [Bacteroidetes bacterium]|nr:MAG: hypothetical protein EP338_13020 [Bacteroidota bacterium]